MNEIKKEEYTYEFLCKPDFTILKVQLQNSQTISVEASSMATMDTNVSMKTKVKGGLLSGLKRKLLTGESLFINDFTAEGGPGEILIAPGAPGDADHYYLEKGRNFFLQSGAYLASSPTIQLNTRWEGFKGFFGGTGLFLIRAEGYGDLFFNTYGGLLEINVEENFIVDSNYVVAFEDTLDYKVELLGGLKSGLLGGEGFVCRFRGQGRLWIQTRQPYSFASWLYPFRPASNDSYDIGI